MHCPEHEAFPLQPIVPKLPLMKMLLDTIMGRLGLIHKNQKLVPANTTQPTTEIAKVYNSSVQPILIP